MKFQTMSLVAGTPACQAKCPFCVSKMTVPQDKTLGSTNINGRNLKKGLLFAERSGVTTVLITGKGEPTLYPLDISE